MDNTLIIPQPTRPSLVLRSPSAEPYHRQDQAPAHLIIYWKFLFQCIGPTIRQSLKLRAYCRLFRDALPPPPVSYLSFPHSQYATLKLLTTHLSTLYKTNPLSIPKHVLISSGTHIVEEHHETICGSNVNLLTIDFPITFLGDSTTETVIEGGFLIKMPETNGDPTSVASVTTTPQTTIKNVTLRRSKWSGIWNHFSSGQVHLENVVVDGKVVSFFSYFVLCFVYFLLFRFLSFFVVLNCNTLTQFH